MRALVLLLSVSGCTSHGPTDSLALRAAEIDLPQVAAVRPGEPRAPVAIEIQGGVLRLDAGVWGGIRVARTDVAGHLIVPLYDWLAWADEVAQALDDREEPAGIAHVEILAAASTPMIDVVDVMYTSGRAGVGRFDAIARGPDGPGRFVVEPPKFCCGDEAPKVRSCVALRFAIGETIEITAWSDHDTSSSCHAPELNDEDERLVSGPFARTDGPDELAARLQPWRDELPLCRLTEIGFHGETPYGDVAHVMGTVQALQPESRFHVELR